MVRRKQRLDSMWRTDGRLAGWVTTWAVVWTATLAVAAFVG